MWKSESISRRTDNTMAKRYQWGNQNPQVEDGQTTQWPKDTNVVIRIHKSKTDRQHNGQKKRTKDKQLSTKHYTENEKRVTQTPLLKLL